MKIFTFSFGGLLLSLIASARAECGQYIPVHQILSAPDGVLNIDDEDGARQIKAEVFNAPDCEGYALIQTGRQFSGNMTTMAQKGVSSNSCKIKNVNGQDTIDSFQAIVVQTNGWPLDNITFNFDDVDTARVGWTEAMSVFGLYDGSLVVPNMELKPDSVLQLKSYNLPATTTDLMNLQLGSVTVPGAQYGTGARINCPFQLTDGPESDRCRVVISFPDQVDTVVILYTLVTRGSTRTNSVAFFSELRMSCGCRCRETDLGSRLITAPVPGVPGQCVRRESTGKKIECDVLGGQWCKKEEMTDYILTSGVLPDGRFDCEETLGNRLFVESQFTPNPNFGRTT